MLVISDLLSYWRGLTENVPLAVLCDLNDFTCWLLFLCVAAAVNPCEVPCLCLAGHTGLHGGRLVCFACCIFVGEMGCVLSSGHAVGTAAAGPGRPAQATRRKKDGCVKKPGRNRSGSGACYMAHNLLVNSRAALMLELCGCSIECACTGCATFALGQL